MIKKTLLIGLAALLTNSCSILPDKVTVDNTKDDKTYLVLFNSFPVVKNVSKLIGFSGNYGHIEVVQDGMAYGCRPPVCSEITLDELKEHYEGIQYTMIEVDHKGDSWKAIQWFRKNLEGKEYDLLYNNCTDAVVKMYDASGDTTRRVFPVKVDEEYNSNLALRTYLKLIDMPKPDRKEIYLPDQFERIGEVVGKGRF